jgi:hypothetical protein
MSEATNSEIKANPKRTLKSPPKIVPKKKPEENSAKEKKKGSAKTCFYSSFDYRVY